MAESGKRFATYVLVGEGIKDLAVDFELDRYGFDYHIYTNG